MLEIVLPGALKYVSVLVMVYSFVSLVVSESALEDIAVEKSLLSLDLRVVVPKSFKDSSFAEVVYSFAFTSSLPERASIAVFIYKL